MTMELKLENRIDELVRRCKAGDEKAFESLVLPHQHTLFSYLARMVGNRTLAQDLYQDTLVKV